MGSSGKLSLCVLLVISIFWKPAYANDCSLACKGSATAPTFLNGHKYNYGVEGTVSIFLTGADKQETSVKLLGQVSVTSLGNCVNELVVQNLAISGPDGKKYSSPEGVNKPVRFTLQDGRLGPELCAEEGDTRRSLNIKRAIISLLQTENKPSTQVDIFGTCPTDASSSQEGSALLVHRSRDLSRCGYREQAKNDLLAGVYNPSAEIKNTQVLQSTLHVESKVNSGVPEKVSATEEYLYRPFSVGENGARAKVHTKLTLTGKAAGAPSGGQFSQTRTVIFENPHGVATSSGNFEAAYAAVKDTAKTLGSEANSKSAGEFAQLVRILRTANKDDLVRIYSQCKTNNLEKRVFLDGLLRAGTGYSIEASIEILKRRELNPLEQQLVFLSLGNAKHVNNEALKAATSLLDQPNLPKEIYLGVGALAGSYCRDHNCHTVRSDGVTALSQKLASKINCRPKSKVEEDNVVAVFKGVGNIHHLEDILVDKLVRCANDNNAKARLRVAALEAFGAEPCAQKLKRAAIELMKNRQLDSEIRIKAYLAVIECPCGGSANEIKKLLESEPVHQVGHFITTSLRHIRASANPDKQHARLHYGQIRTPNKFNVDDRKYSFYRELSYNVDALGVGGSVEQTVIYSQDSFLPRSSSLNLTAELFGHSLNVLEVGGRQGNLDRVIEHFLGPKSFLRTEKPQDIYDNIVKRFHEAEKKVEDGLSRGRRSVKTEIDNFDKHLKAESAPFNNELDLDIYVKLFGTDAVFLSLGDDKGVDANRILDQLLRVVNGGVNQAKHFQQEIRAHLLFLDAELAYPTSTGLPLKLDLVGSATGRLEVGTNVDLRQIYRNPNDAKIDIKLVPSTDIEISGLFLVDADVVSTGLKVVTNLHSSTGGHLIAKVLENGNGIDIQFALPIDKQEIVTASNDLVYVTAEKGKKEKHVPIRTDADRKEYSECFDQLSNVLGLTLCGEVSVPFSVSGQDAQASISKFIARYPLTGASKVKLVLEKNDLRGYHIKGVLHNDRPEFKSFELLFEAQGSRNRRTRVSGEMIRSRDEDTLKLALESPIRTISGQVSYIHKSNEHVALFKGNLDNAEYYAKAGFLVQGNDRRSIFRPLLEYQLPEDQKHSLKVDGQLIRDTNGPVTKYSLEGIKIHLPNNNEVVEVNGHVSREPRGLEMDVKAKTGAHNLLLSGSVKGPEVRLEFQNTLNPNVNFKLNGHFENGELYHNDIEVWYGRDLRSPHNRVSFNQLLKYHKKSPKEFNVISKNKFEIHALPFKVKVDAEVDPKKLDIDLEGQYMDKKAELDLEARTHIKKPGDYSLKIKADADNRGVEVFAKRDIVSADKSNLENYIVFKGVGKYELSGVVLHRTKPNDVKVGAIGHLKISGSGKNEDIKFDFGAIENANLYSSHAKVSGTRGELLDYLLKVTRGANASGQLKLILKDSVAVNGQFKVTDSDGKGNGMIIVDFKKSQRKIKGDVSFVVKDPVYNAEFDVFLNYEKDNNDKVHFSTNSKISENVIESKNKLEYNGQKTEVNVHRDGPVSSLGRSHANVEVVLPTERCLSLKLDQDIDVKDEVYNGHAEFVLSDATKRGGPASLISFKTKTVNTNIDQGAIDVETQAEFKLKDGRNLLNSFYCKVVPLGDDTYKYDYKIETTGSLITKPASFSGVGSTVLSGKYMDEKYSLKGNYGSDMGFEFKGVWDVKFSEKGDGKWLDDYTVILRLPFQKAHDIKWISTVLYVKPDGSKDNFELTVIESVQVNADLYKVDASGKFGLKQGNTKVKVLVPHQEPFILDVGYQADESPEGRKGKVDVRSQYGRGKTAHLAVGAVVAPQQYSIQVSAAAPQADKLKKLEFSVINKRPSPDTFSSSANLEIDGQQTLSYDAVAVTSKVNPVLDIKYKCHKTGASRVYLKGTGLSSTQGKLDVKLENVHEITLDSTYEFNVQKDSIATKMWANSDKLGFKDYKVEIQSKDAGSGKRLEFHATNDGKNVLSGSTSFISKQEGPKTIIEGSGSVKVKDEQKSANFKYIRTLLTEGSEQGVETFLKLAIGDRSYVAESRVTNLEYKTSYVYCEETKQCANAELQSKINMPHPGVFQHLLNVGFDLRKLGFAPEFGLEVTSEVSEKKFPQYSLDLHVNKEDKKYYLHVYSTPEIGKFPAGITVTLPQRVLALEALVTYPTNKALPFPIRGEAALHLDKNRPQQKTAARFLIDASGSEKQHAVSAEFGFSHPRLGREATVKIRGNLQRPGPDSIKLETTASASCSDRDAKIYFEADPNHVKLLVDTPLVQVIDVEASADIRDNIQKSDLKFSLLQGKPVLVHAIVKDFQYYEFTTGYSDESERKLSIVGHIEPEKRIDISADIVLANQKKNIAHGALFLQDNLVKTDYGVSKDNYKYFVNALEKDISTLEQRIKQLGERASNEFKNKVRQIEPQIKTLDKAFKEDLDKLYKEVVNDQALKEIYGGLEDVAKFLAKIIDDILQATRPLVENLTKTFEETSKKILELYEKQIEPSLKQLYGNVSAAIREYFEGLLDIVAHFAALIADFFEKHKPELQELSNTIAEIFKDLTRLIVAQLKEFRAKSSAVLSDLLEQFKDLPIVNLIKEKWQELAIPEQVLGVLHEAHNTLRGILPTEETRNFADALYNYAQKKLRLEKVDDARELRIVYEKFVVALTSVIQFVRGQLNTLGVPSLLNINTLPLLSGPGPASAPALGGLASFSLLNQLLKGDMPDPLALIRAYRPRSLNPLDEVPAKLRAVVINGQHIFTFDGRHLTFPGSCRYVLAHDYADRNFTLAIQLQNGAPKALVLEDKSGTIIELKENGQVTLNGAQHGFPAIDKDVFAFRQTNGRVGLGSLYGLMAFCTPKLEVCYIEVNGFYLGKLRGLLGDGNNEPFDDFRMPNGKITNSESEFGNSYRLATSCPQVRTPEHSHHQHHAALPPACEQVFGATSPLRPLSLVLDVAPFRQACIHAVTGSQDALREACDLGRGYTALALTGLLPAVLPPVCLKCTDHDQPKNVGDEYEIRLPAKKADIIVTVETTKVNAENYKDLVVPLVSQLVDSLKSKHINDIKVYLVGLTSKYPYPIVYDTDLKLKSPKVVFDDNSRVEFTPTVQTGVPQVDLAETFVADLVDFIKIKLGVTNVDAGYASLLDLPLRPGAVKHAILLIGDRCESTFAPLELLSEVVYGTVFQQMALSQTLVTVTPDMKIGNGKNPANIVGYTKDAVLMLGDKKQGKEAEALRATLEQPDNDACIDYIDSTHGLVLSSSNYKTLNPGQQKQFLQTAVVAITNRLLGETLVQECTCGYVDPFRVRSLCFNKERKEAARRRK